MTTPGFRPTHVVPQHGMPAWEAPDSARPTADLDPLLPVQLLERQGDWGHVLCFNGWSAWVDGRRLVAVPQDPPTTDGPLTRTADPRPLLARAEEALSRYRSAVEDLAGGLDGESFRNRTRGLRIGVVIDGESMWLYDAAHGHWVYADGTQLTTYAADETPRSDPGHRPAGTPPVRPPARVVPPEDFDELPRAARPSRPPDAPPTRVVPPGPPAGPEAPEPAPEPTRVVSPGPPAGPEPTRVVSPGTAAPEASEPTRVGSPGPPAGPEPTRVLSREAPAAPEPTRVVSSEETEAAEEARRPGGAPATRVVGQEPTRIVRSEGEGR